MAATGSERSRQVMEEEVWTAISAFQQILQAMPNDRGSLEALSHAFEKIGDHTQARSYMLQLAEVLLEQEDAPAVEALLPRIGAYFEGGPEADALIPRMKELVSSAALGAAEAVDMVAPAVQTVRQTFSIAEELSCAWNLMQGGELSEEEYSAIVQDLGEMSGSEGEATVSVLHVLEARAHKNMERIINSMARECGAPFVSLSSFNLQRKAVALLPMDLVIRRGTLIFDFVGEQGLAVVMNPYDKSLRKDVETASGIACSFFITLPSEFDRAVRRTQIMLSSAEDQVVS